MAEATATFEVRRHSTASLLDIRGDVTAGSEDVLMEAYDAAGDARAIVLNFTELTYMNSGGIGLLVTLLAFRSSYYRKLSAAYAESPNDDDTSGGTGVEVANPA